MHLELTDNEVIMMRSALEHYRIKKSAEKMLKGQAALKTSDTKAQQIYAQYDTVLRHRESRYCQA